MADDTDDDTIPLRFPDVDDQLLADYPELAGLIEAAGEKA